MHGFGSRLDPPQSGAGVVVPRYRRVLNGGVACFAMPLNLTSTLNQNGAPLR
jgi:hypothetical protein